jgi:hypothetical protein
LEVGDREMLLNCNTPDDYRSSLQP